MPSKPGLQILFSALVRAPTLFSLAETICHADRFNGHVSILSTGSDLLSLESYRANCHHGHGEKRQDLRSWFHLSQFQQTFIVQCVFRCKKLKCLLLRATSASHFLLYSQRGTRKCSAGSGGPKHLQQPLLCPNS